MAISPVAKVAGRVKSGGSLVRHSIAVRGTLSVGALVLTETIALDRGA